MARCQSTQQSAFQEISSFLAKNWSHILKQNPKNRNETHKIQIQNIYTDMYICENKQVSR